MRHSILQSFRVSVLLTVLLLSVPSYAQFYFDFGYSEDSVVYVGATTTEYTIDFQLKMDSLQEVFHSASFSIGNFSTLDLPKPYYFDYMDSVGRPMLPIRRINLEVPEGFDMDLSFSSISFTYEYFDLKYPYYPFQDIREDTINSFVYYEPSYMHSPDWTLDNEVTISPYFHFFDEKGFYVDIRPYSYDPLHNQVRVIKKMQATIPLVGDHLGNYNDLTSLHIFDWNTYMEKLRDSIGHGSCVPRHAPILIVTPQSYLNTLEHSYIPYRENQHHIVTTITLEDIAENNNVSTSNLTPEMIITAIQNEYNHLSWKPKYLLLIGDPYVIPYASGSGCYLSPYTDFGYSLATTSCGTMTMPLAVGRWPVGLDNHTQLTNMMLNMMMFEKYTSNFASRTVLPVDIASSGGAWAGWIYSSVEDNYDILKDKFHVTKYDGRQYTQCHLSHGILVNDFQDDLWMFIYHGHGNENGFTDPVCINTGILSTFEGSIPTMIFAYSCNTNSSDFGINWIGYKTSTTYGAASYLGSTTSATIISDNIYSNNICKNFRFDHLGQIMVAANQQYYNGMVWRKNQIKRYVLLGDPAMHVFGYNDNNEDFPYIPYGNYNEINPAPMRETGENESDDFESTIKQQEGHMYIYNANGMLMYDGITTDQHSMLALYPSGIYYVVIQNGTTIRTQTLIK